MSGKHPLAILIRLKDCPVCFRAVLFQPGKKRGAEVVADFRIGVNDVYDLFVGIEDAGGCIRGVTLYCYLCIPVMIRIGSIL